MSRPTKTQTRQDSHKIAKDLFLMEKPFKDMNDQREELKEQLREFGANVYIFDGGVVTVGDPEVRSFKGQTFVLNADAFVLLSSEARKDLIDKGLVKIEDIYSRNAKAKVETKLT